MIWPAGSKVLALSVVAGESMKQGSILRFADLNDGTGRLQAFKVDVAGDIDFAGVFMAYYITPDSEDVDFVGAPESTTFTVNTDTGVGGGTLTIASGTECVALGGHAVALVRLDKNSVFEGALTSYTPSTNLKIESTDSFLSLDANDDINVVAGKVVQNDGASVVVLLA